MTDRRVQRTRELLQNALGELILERGYDSVTIQDIADRANVGRTTFYVHYRSIDDLFVSCHESIVSEFDSGPLYPHPLSREELLAVETPPGMILAYRHLEEARARLYPIFQGKDGPLILRRIRDWSAQEIEANLHAALPKPTAPSRLTCWQLIWPERRLRWCNGCWKSANRTGPKTWRGHFTACSGQRFVMRWNCASDGIGGRNA